MLRRVSTVLLVIFLPLLAFPALSQEAAQVVSPAVVPEQPAEAALPDLAAIPRIAPRPLSSALHAMRAGRWETARMLAARDGPAAVTLIHWYYLSGGLGTPDEVLSFLRDHPDWPGLEYLRKRSEKTMANADPDTVLEFFENADPQTGTGALGLARARIARDQLDEAHAGIIDAWQKMDLTTQEHNDFLAAYGDLIAPYHAARLDMALWRGLKDVDQMLPLVSDKQRDLAELRRTLSSRAPVKDELIEGLTTAQRRDPGIAYALFNRHIRGKGRAAANRAIDLAITQSRIEDGLGRPGKWAGWRRALARSLMREGKAQRAYDLASVHQLTEGSAYSDLEWLSGYLALTYLDNPALALDHFNRFSAAVRSPISRGRAGYWIGRAHAALGNDDAAQSAYLEGARYPTSFYGLLAAEKAGVSVGAALNGTQDFPAWQGTYLSRSHAVQAAMLANAAGQLNLAERFVATQAARLDRTGLAQLAAMLDDMEAAHLQVMLGKGAARRGIVLPGPYYALHPMTDLKLPVPYELALSIARRESEFDADVVSGAGAQGLMQVMPGTARDVARDLGLEHDPDRVLSDWTYNALLGSTYLAQMAERFDGNIIMISAAYNAGPARPPRWIEQFGDPRSPGGMDIIDWIEHIPFRETRNYVMRVAESLPVYRARLGKTPLPVPFSQELTGATIAPAPYSQAPASE